MCIRDSVNPLPHGSLFGVQFGFDEPRDDAVTRAEDILANDTLERQLLTALFALDEEPQLLRKGPQRLNHITRRVAARTARTARHALAAVPDRIALQKLLDGCLLYTSERPKESQIIIACAWRILPFNIDIVQKTNTESPVELINIPYRHPLIIIPFFHYASKTDIIVVR